MHQNVLALLGFLADQLDNMTVRITLQQIPMYCYWGKNKKRLSNLYEQAVDVYKSE